MELDIRVSEVFSWNQEALANPQIRNIINQGGSRSSKTYSLCQLLIVYSLTNSNKLTSIVRKSFPALRATIMRDFFEVMNYLKLYEQKNHNKTENIYTFPNGSVIEFFSVDDEQKLRGRKRNVLFCNEANELTRDEYTQLNIRTTEKLVFDFNPSDTYHWLYELAEKDNSVLIKSTYKNNPFLEESLVKEIEDLISVDEDYYKVYALGERTMLKSTIYSHYSIESIPEEYDEVSYGIDLGFNHPTALVQLGLKDGVCYIKELIYSSNLTSNDLMDLIKIHITNKKKEILVDSARPDIIEDLKRLGYNAKGANKEVTNGIIAVKSQKLVIDKESINLIKEIRNYKWKSKGDIVIDEPVKLNDDLMDAMRYVIFNYYNSLKKPNGFANFKIKSI